MNLNFFLLIVVVSSVVHSYDEDLFSYTYTAQQHYISLQASLQLILQPTQHTYLLIR